MSRGGTWRDQAACRDEDSDLFFSDKPQGVAEAQAICGGCPVRASCLADALQARPVAGVWGGHLFNRGKPVTEEERADPKGVCRGCSGPGTSRYSRWCGACRPAANVQARHAYQPQPITHGTEAGARTHHRRGERVRQPCRDDANRVAYDRRRAAAARRGYNAKAAA